MKSKQYVAEVKYNSAGKSYSYLYNPKTLPLHPGDELLVPVGNRGKQARALVVSVKGNVSKLNPRIKYKTIPDSAAEAIPLFAKEREILLNNKKMELIEQLRDTPVDF